MTISLILLLTYQVMAKMVTLMVSRCGKPKPRPRGNEKVGKASWRSCTGWCMARRSSGRNVKQLSRQSWPMRSRL